MICDTTGDVWHMGCWSVTCYHAGLGFFLCMYPSVIVAIPDFEGTKASCLFFMFFLWGHWSQIEWKCTSSAASRSCVCEGAAMGSRGMVTLCAALWTIVLMFIHLQSGWTWTNLKSPKEVMNQHISGGTMEWVCFVDWVFCWSPFPPQL